METVDYKQLIPELKKWEEHNDRSFTPNDWIACVGNYEHAIGYIAIFWPEFYEYDGCIFVGNPPDEENYRSWLRGTNGDKKSVEAVMNHIHIKDLFQVDQLNPTELQIKYIGSKLQDMWLAKVKKEFPCRNISVEFYESNENDLAEYQVTLFQNEHKSQ